MAFPSCCICDIVGADVGINVGADIEEDVIDNYFLVRNKLDSFHCHISVFIRGCLNVTSISYYQYCIDKHQLCVTTDTYSIMSSFSTKMLSWTIHIQTHKMQYD